jgi:paraquat-inducible protein B
VSAGAEAGLTAEQPAHESLSDSEPLLADGPRASAVERKRRFSFVWLVPVVAAALVIYLGFTTLARRGPEITLHFQTADGLVEQQTLLKYKSVPLGTVEDVDLGGRHADVVVRVRMQRSAKFLLTNHARFWVVRPRFTLANISGLDTLVSGAYIAVDPGLPGGKTERDFVGLEEPPGTTSDQPGRTFDLKASRIGSLSEGAPVVYRDVTVGALLKYDLPDDLGPVSLRVFIRAPYDQLVHADTLFWNASGVSLTTGSDGIHLELESIETLLTGGIAFETPADERNMPLGKTPVAFRLYESKPKADAAIFRLNTPCVSYFRSSVQGLGRGSSVEIFGVQIGAVSDVKLVFDSVTRRFVARVEFDLQPERMLKPSEYDDVSGPGVRALVADGLRVVLDSSNLITGQRVLSLQYMPNTKGELVTQEGDALVLPSHAGGIGGIITAMADVAAKLDRLPFEEMGNNLNNALRSLNDAVGGPDLKNAIASLSQTMKDVGHVVHEADTNLTPAMQRLPTIAGDLQAAIDRARDALGADGYGRNSDVQRNLARMIDQVAETARTVRFLADFLDHHPEALLFGRTTHTSAR